MGRSAFPVETRPTLMHGILYRPQAALIAECFTPQWLLNELSRGRSAEPGKSTLIRNVTTRLRWMRSASAWSAATGRPSIVASSPLLVAEIIVFVALGFIVLLLRLLAEAGE